MLFFGVYIFALSSGFAPIANGRLQYLAAIGAPASERTDLRR
jgi:hypothetical protein